MTGPVPPRLRAPLVIIGACLATGLADVTVRGWATTPVVTSLPPSGSRPSVTGSSAGGTPTAPP
ncbi:hypothetical protein [Streptomyces nodosus]|uniref:hypothetical protein n=1 Tax=Streptomyces nodosus TaxID=40318 RepID=UPI0011861AB1|nr:hypothetical protein [Streptomyces nodosus]MBB4789745.1 hypothetical protein [Streptomyces nodosus]